MRRRGSNALGVFFFLLVLQLQVVAGCSATLAGTALLPVTVLMLLLSTRSGALADRTGAWPAGLGGADYTDPAAYAEGVRYAMLISAGLLVVAALPAVLVVRPAARAAAPEPRTALRLAECRHCGVGAPQLHPGATGGRAR